MKQEPYVWVHKLEDVSFDGQQITVAPDKDDYYTIPLYTALSEEQFFEKAKTVSKQIDNGTYSKDLSDEEIIELRETEWGNYQADKESKGIKTACITDDEWDIWFARAILKEASEK